MEAEEAKHVQVDGKDDKRQITAVFACTWLVISCSHSWCIKEKPPDVSLSFNFHQGGVYRKSLVQ